VKVLYERTLVIDGIEDPQEKIAGVHIFIELLLERIYGQENAKEYLENLMHSRYFPIHQIFEKLQSWQDPNFCSWKNKFSRDNFESRFQKDIEFAALSFKNCQGLDVSIDRKDIQSIRDLEVGDFIEVLASQAVGGENVYSFFTRCFF